MIKILFIFSFALVSLNTLCQDNKPLTNDSLKVEMVNKNIIPELNVFIDSALIKSPLLLASDREIDILLEEIKIKKRSWLDYIQIDANTRYGLFNQLSIQEMGSNSDLNPIALQTAKEQFNYFAGLTLKLPLSNFTNNKNEIKKLKYSIDETNFKKDALKKEITLLVIEEYYKLKNLQESMNVLQDIMQTIKISYLQAKNDVKNGTMKLSEFATLVTSMGKAVESYLKSKNDYYSQYFRIQILTGINLQKNK